MLTLNDQQEKAYRQVIAAVAAYNPPIVESNVMGLTERCEHCKALWIWRRNEQDQLRVQGDGHKSNCIVILARRLETGDADPFE